MSVVEDFGDLLDSGCCGYCGGRKERAGDSSSPLGAQNSTLGVVRRRLRGALWAHRLCPEDYQLLMDRGWRRSGCFVYLPDNEHGCCPQYAVRIPLQGFEPTRSQRRVLRRWCAFVRAPGELATQCFLSYGFEGTQSLDQRSRASSIRSSGREQEPAEATPTDARLEVLRTQLEPSLRRVPRKSQAVSRGAHFTTALAWKLAHEHKTSVTEEANQLAALLWRRGAEQLGIARIDVNHGHVNLYDGMELGREPMANTRRPGPSSHPVVVSKQPKAILRMELLRPEYRENAFCLYCKYQRRIHGDAESELRPERYSRFLVDHPFRSECASYGAFHLHMYIDDELVIVSVLDILPGCLSSKYCFYDPDLPPRLSAGIFAALCEIQFARHVLHVPYYYLGFYIHSCRKMQYKISFRGSQLLCGHCFHWKSFDDVARRVLDQDEHCVGFCTESTPYADQPLNLKPRLETVLVWLLDACGCSAALAPQALATVEPRALRERVYAALRSLASMVPSELLEHMVYLPPRSAVA
ncbi:hypothetical protein CCYA_CCYA07G2136 [Cyanidiococcus yangmingshanensis]|nr:hypothetical protein CCYA_CCYA07G2136 [Cyanidiococcus yangmingshanensis]